MINNEDTKMEIKREEIIEELVENGVFKIHGKQLYELPLYTLVKEHMITTQ
ncbi:Fur-regulated basic protein FbpA [Sporosarcina sp. 179-K 3D1 HS]|uniref:Fur-regulated basic protein FbpA n=1 Tax=Sporosarcina sp. 179-K 3D1 HS TaxID=3232169 RepID=UPI0039A0B42B